MLIYFIFRSLKLYFNDLGGDGANSLAIFHMYLIVKGCVI